MFTTLIAVVSWFLCQYAFNSLDLQFDKKYLIMKIDYSINIIIKNAVSIVYFAHNCRYFLNSSSSFFFTCETAFFYMSYGFVTVVIRVILLIFL